MSRDGKQVQHPVNVWLGFSLYLVVFKPLNVIAPLFSLLCPYAIWCSARSMNIYIYICLEFYQEFIKVIRSLSVTGGMRAQRLNQKSKARGKMQSWTLVKTNDMSHVILQVMQPFKIKHNILMQSYEILVSVTPQVTMCALHPGVLITKSIIV